MICQASMDVGKERRVVDAHGLLSFLEQKEDFYSSKDFSLFKKAIGFAKEYLSSQKRLFGDSLYEHNLRVAKILAENKASPETLLAGLLHGIVKFVSASEVEEAFGAGVKEVLEIVQGVEDISKIKLRNEQLAAEALRKVLLATVRDVRIILVKLADKLDNLFDVEVLGKEEVQRICQEVLEIYAPLAYRLGVEKVRVSLEDLAFKRLHPKKYSEIQHYLDETREEREEHIAFVLDKIKKESPVKILKIKGRSKHVYSIYKKMTERGVKLDRQYDHLGIRILVSDEKECYSLLAFLHQAFEPIAGRLKDYIAHPKPNGYQSLHTSVLLGEGRAKGAARRLEVQIRTLQMDEFAEEGLAAHWRYKGMKSDYSFEKRMAWLKGVLDMQKDASAREFLENVQVDVFTDEIHCYTPKGEVKYFPKGSTVLDFAYSVHEEVGNHTFGARINGKFVSIKAELEDGAVIEILTSKKQLPRRNWIKYVKSTRAKQKIRKGVKKYQNLPALHYRTFKPVVDESHASLVHSLEHSNAACVLAKCCLPVPCENIVGIITKRRLVSVHKQNCRLALKEEERWVPVEWKDMVSKKIEFFVTAGERSGLLADLLHTIAQARFQVQEAKAKFLGTGNSECSFVIVPKEMSEIALLVARLKKVKGVKQVYFS